MALKADQADLAQLEGDVNLFKEESNLKDAIQDSKIKDIENVLSTANLNQSAQVSVSGTSPLSLPKNVANGGMSVKLEGLTEDVGGVITNFEPTGRVRSDIGGRNLLISSNLDRLAENFTYNTTKHLKARINYYFNFIVELEPNTEYVVSNKKIIHDGSGEEPENTLSLAIYGEATSAPKQHIGRLHSGSSISFKTNSNITQTDKLLFYPTGSTRIDFEVLELKLEKGNKETPWTPAPEDVLAGKAKGTGTSLYLIAPELRSNGAVKDEIRKGANGYELVKRVGVGTSNGEIVEGGDFSDPTKWVLSGTAIISNGTLKLSADAGIASRATQNKTITAGRIYRYKIDVLSITGVAYLYIGNNPARRFGSDDSGKTISGFFLSETSGDRIQLSKDLNTNASAEFDNISIFEYNTTEGAAIEGGEAVYGDNIHYTLATPEITPISYGGILNSAENGTVYHEPIIADAGVYDTKMDILLTDYPIATIEEIIKYENGVNTYLNVASAVVASDGLSFTHPDLADGDLVLFTYAFDKESTNGNITATFYDSNVVKIDTVTGKAYKIEDVVTNGVLTRTLIEV